MKPNQKGVALIMVLVIVALVTIIATQLITERNLHARRSSNILLADNAWEFAVGAETLAGIALVKSLKDETSVHLNQLWASEGIVFPIEGGNLAAEVKDLRSCFNLNGVLGDSEKGDDEGSEPPSINENNKQLAGEKVFAELIKTLKFEEAMPAEALAARLRDWMDSDQQPAGLEGREDYEYSGYAQPYRTGDSILGSRTELSTVSGFNPDLIARLLPYVCVIPGVTELVLNVNTIASDQPELLSSFYDKLDTNTAASVLSARPIDGFDQSSFDQQLPAEATLHNGAKIDFTSPYFSVISKVELGPARVILKSLLHYEANARDIKVLARLGNDD